LNIWKYIIGIVVLPYMCVYTGVHFVCTRR
jgi:hypothetical protein